MKTFTHCAEKMAKQILNLLQGYTKGIRITAVLILLLMGVSNAWADPYISGFGLQFRDDGGAWFKTGTKGGDGIMDLDLGSKTNLKIVYIYANGNKNGGNLCGDNYFKYGINGTTTTSNWGGVNRASCSWSGSTPTYKWGTENSSSAFIDLVQNKLPGDYSMEFIFSFNGANNTYDCETYYDCKYNGDNWKFSWSIPDPTITITGADALVVGTSTNIKATMSNYPIGSTISKIQVSGNTTSKSATGSTDNLTVSSVTPNASGKNGITVTVTVKFGTGGTKDYTYTYNVTPPAVNNFKVTASNVVSGTGTSGDPYVIACGKTTTLTVSGNKASTDANSSLYAKFGNNTYSSTLTKNLTPNSTKQSVQVKAKYYNSKDDLSGTEKSTTIYYRAQTFAVNITSSGNGTVTPSGTQQVGATPVSITATPDLGYAFKQWEVTDGAKVADATNASTTLTATAAGTVKAIFEEKPATTIYLEPTGHWNSDKAVFQAHVWQTGKTGVNLNMVGIGDPSHADGDNKSPYRYYKVEVPYGYDKILFFRKDNFATANANAWNKTGDLTIPTDNKTLYVITDNTTSPTTGVWKEANLVYTITLGYCEFGTYGIKYNGQSYFSKQPNENVTIDVPAGAQIEILEGQPHSNAYTGDVIKAKPTKEKLTIGQALTINGDKTLDDNFVTKEPHVVYLGIPDVINTTEIWAKADKANFIYTWDTYASYGLVASTRSFRIDALGITYYEFTIPEERHSFRFQRKTSLDDKGTPHCESVSLEHEIPLTDVNCFTLKNEKDGSNRYKGDWSVLPAQTGDYRILYVEQTVEYGEIRFDKSHPSDIVKLTNPGDKAIVSLHLYNKRAEGVNGTNNAAVILQRCTGYDAGVAQWEEVEYHMVYNYLFSDASAALLPGRRNTVELQAHDGLEVIKAVADSEEHNYGSGVWNFTIQKTDGSATLLLDDENLTPYKGNYYIRTDNAEGGWDQYTLNDNYMTYSKYAEDHSGFSHYFCKYVDIAEDPKNVKFVIANDHGTAISDTLDGDDFVPKENNGSIYKGELQESANVRWSWNQYTNEVKRAYIKGSSEKGFLTVTQKSGKTTNFEDNGNWIYEADITAAVGDKITAITAPYRDQDQSLLELTYQTEGMPLLTGDPSGTHDIRVMYDFKINKTMALLVPGAGVKTTIDVLIERTDHGQATQVANAIQKSDENDGYTVYAALNFTENNVVNAQYTAQRLYYWVSFPFDVRISEVFGFGEYGKHWIMQYYDGAARAANGAWADSPSYWRNITDTANLDNSTTLNSGILKANQGYVLALAKKIATMGVFEHTKTVTLYFPSREKQHIMNPGVKTIAVELESHLCGINRPTPDGDRRIKDSHWHVLGVPSYSDHSQELTQNDLMFFYQRRYDSADGYTVQSAQGNEVQLQSLHSYYVQFAGKINWNAKWDLTGAPQEMAARKNVTAEESHNLRLELQQNGSNADQTFITLKDEDGITPMFDMNKDLTKIINSGVSVYTLIATDRDPIELAGNVLPIANTVIPVGVQIATAGEYTFAMPDGTDGITVELIDYETNTRTNLLLSEYTVDLSAGTFETRFALHVKPSKVTTSLEDGEITTTNGKVRKFLIDGVLYLQKDGNIYDAQGRKL